MNAFERKTLAARLLPLMMMGALAACGGGGSDDTGGGGNDDDNTANTGPTVSAGADQEALARKNVTLAAAADDADGSVSSVGWTQTDGTEVTLTAGDSGSATFTAPDVDTQETLTFTVTATDDDGATATDTMSVVVTPSVTLSAKAYDGPLKNATVTVTVGDRTYTATTNDEGVFVLDIGSPDPDAMITIVATGGPGQENAELVSIAGTFGALATAAGEDGTLESTESGVVDVTNLSTAKAVLMIEANGGAAPTDDSTLTDLEKSIDSSAVLELATVIKLVIDEDIPLPEGVESTLDMVESDAAVDEVVATAAETDASLFDDTLDAILDDPNVSPGFVAAEIPGIYFINRAGGFVSASRGFTAELKEGGSGFIYGSGPDESAAITWTVDSNGKLQVNIDDADPFLSSGSCSTEIGLQTCNLTVTALTFSLVIEGASVDTISMSRTGTVTYPSGLLPDGELGGSALYLAMEPNALEMFTAEKVKGTWSVPLSFPNPDPLVGDRYETNLLTFNADGTGTRPQDGMTFTWTIDTDGILAIAFANGDALDIYWLRPEGELGMDAMVIMTTAGGDIYTQPHLIVSGVDMDFAGSLHPDGLDGTWHYMDWSGFDYGINTAAGTAMQIFYDGPGDTTPHEVLNGFMYDGIAAQVITYIDAADDGNPGTQPYNGPLIADCSVTTACYTAYISTWYPLAKDSSGRIFMLEVDEGWWYDDTNTATYQGDKNYRHSVNRWLGPTGTDAGGAAKTSAPESGMTRGALVRKHLDPLQIMTR